MTKFKTRKKDKQVFPTGEGKEYRKADDYKKSYKSYNPVSQELESKIHSVSDNQSTAYIVQKERWDDTLPNLLTEEGIENHWEGDVLSIDNGRATIAYVDLEGTRWQTCHNWIPLFRIASSYKECLNEAGKDSYYAIPYEDNRGRMNKEKVARRKFETAGFQTDTFEGF